MYFKSIESRYRTGTRALEMLFIACVRAWASNIFLIIEDSIMYYGLSKGMTVVLV